MEVAARLCWLARGALYFMLALLTGMLITIRPLTAAVPFIGALSPVYFHLFMVGWVTQLIFGVVYWMFPRYSRDKPRGSEGWQTRVGVIMAVAGSAVSFKPDQLEKARAAYREILAELSS